MAKDLTTGQVAKYCGVTVRTVINWINAGHLNAYKLPGERGDHRIAVGELKQFMQGAGMPLPDDFTQESTTDKTATILLVDDDPALLSALKRVLRPLRANIITATNSFAAGQAFSLHQPALMTLDIHMPGLNGIELLQNLRSDGVTCKIMVISGADDVWLKKAKTAGANAVMSKPYSPSELLVTVERLLIKDGE